MKIAVIGGGINGIMTAWELCKHHHDVTLFEKNTLMSQTSSASSKLLHGGLRYLENFEFRLVKEALRERQWWINQAPDLARPLVKSTNNVNKAKREYAIECTKNLISVFGGKWATAGCLAKKVAKVIV